MRNRFYSFADSYDERELRKWLYNEMTDEELEVGTLQCWINDLALNLDLLSSRFISTLAITSTIKIRELSILKDGDKSSKGKT